MPGISPEVLGLGLSGPSAAVVNDVLRAVGGGEGAIQRFLSSRMRSRKRAALLYAEILYNLASLNNVQKMTPPQLLVSRTIWTAVVRNPDYFAGILNPIEIAALAGPYLHLETLDRLLRQEPVSLMWPRLKGLDQTAIEAVAEQFREAEKLVRKRAFSPKVRKRLDRSETLQGLHEVPDRQGRWMRVHGAAASLPLSYWLGGAIAVLLAGVLGDMRNSLRALASEEKER